jgi:hypothetical protein
MKAASVPNRCGRGEAFNLFIISEGVKFTSGKRRSMTIPSDEIESIRRVIAVRIQRERKRELRGIFGKETL